MQEIERTWFYGRLILYQEVQFQLVMYWTINS